MTPWPMEPTLFIGAAAVQGLLAAALIIRHNRQEWVWTLAVLFAFNGAVALMRGLVAASPVQAPLCASCGFLWSAALLWMEPATVPLLAYFFLIYPERPGWAQRQPWLLRAVVLAPVLLQWGLIVFARPFVQPDGPFNDWRDYVHFATFTGVQLVGWCVVLLRGAWMLPRVASPPLQRQFGLLFGIVGMRAAHVGSMQALGVLQGILDTGLSASVHGLAGHLFALAFFVAPVAALPVAAAILFRARPRLPATHSRSVVLALAFMAAGVVWTFLPGPDRLGTDLDWYRVLTHYELYVLRPVVVWLAVVLPRFPGLVSGRLRPWSTALPATYAAAGAYVAARSSFLENAQGIVFSYTLGILAAAAALLLVAFLLRSLALAEAGTGPRAALRGARDLERYASALEAAWRHPEPDAPTRRRLARLRRRLGVSAEQHAGLVRSLQGEWAGPAAGAEWQPGDLLASRYEVVSLLGQGGSGETYRCRDVLAGRDVVLKRTHRLDAAGRRALAVEAAALARVSSDRVVRCRRVDTIAGLPVLVLDFLPGGSLQGRLARQGRLPARQVRTMAQDLLEGLEAAHAAGIVHGDVKPSNVLFDAQGHAVLADFGAARAAPGVVDLADATQPGPPPGSLRYMAPEQVRGLPADARTDLYALAVVLCEAATGIHPLPPCPSDFETRQAIVRGGLRLPLGLPSPLHDALRPALEADPARRPPSAASMAAALRPGGPAQERNRRRLRPTPTTSPP